MLTETLNRFTAAAFSLFATTTLLAYAILPASPSLMA